MTAQGVTSHVDAATDGRRVRVRFQTTSGTPLREAAWERLGDELVLRRTHDCFYPDGDPGCRVPYVDIPTVTREFTKKGAMVVTYAPPGRVSGVTGPDARRESQLPSFAGGAHEGFRNGRVHSVRGIAVPRVQAPDDGNWTELLAASQPPELDRFGAGAEAAAQAFSEEQT